MSENSGSQKRTLEDTMLEYKRWADETEPAKKGWAQKRGYAFERILNELFELEGLQPRTNYRPAGEEIDGSLVVDQRTFLLEAKWWKQPLPASQLYAFKGKLDGKLNGTLGIVISHSGFADDAVDALVSGKSINIILFDAHDIAWILGGHVSFSDALHLKLRHAAEYGQPFMPLAPRIDHPKAAANVVVAGPADEAGVEALFMKLSPERDAQVKIWTALGASNLVAVARELDERGEKDVTVFIDGAKLREFDLGESFKVAREEGIGLLAFEPSFIDVLERACEVDYANSVPETSSQQKHARRMATHTVIERLWAASPALKEWWSHRTTSRDTNKDSAF